ncbi:heavy-metal-associated domain-containing protein [Plasticicumulans sp.]|uniref:heavy-metal-associated domain-containing protein n=1 Tax=Plasticicumulans sp. TaxID=2307179 RepID=UPI002BF49FDF|nr:cation transporter [Plasticicumulans sp.]MBS0600086.1 heavy-metal-associated domain-containing protein [Pseudomonadota bacterium]HMW28352.1 cation transporter [Plasticicumulans sp.]HMW43551.1 cation transporter [Plasticicumulans sp.]HMZ11347.1 cation transporter [Plasticicumulans sp.]HNB90250.1 cation transporter [Plasticicumulans sp.]
MNETITLKVPDMNCGHCVRAIETAVRALDARAEVRCDLDAKTVQVATGLAGAAVLEAIREAGYTPST